MRAPLWRTPPPQLYAPLAEVAHATPYSTYTLYVEYSTACTTPEVSPPLRPQLSHHCPFMVSPLVLPPLQLGEAASPRGNFEA